MAETYLTPTQSYAAGALFALALRQSQIHQTSPLGLSFTPNSPLSEYEQEQHKNTSIDANELRGKESRDRNYVQDEQLPWTHKKLGLLRPVLRYLGVDQKAWLGIEETAAMPSLKHHIGAFLRMLSEVSDEKIPQERTELLVALSKAVDALSINIDNTSMSGDAAKETPDARGNDSITTGEGLSTDLNSESVDLLHSSETSHKGEMVTTSDVGEDMPGILVDLHTKIAVLFVLLSACLADPAQNKNEDSPVRKGYDARHRVTLRLLATWLDVRWSKMDAMEIMISCSAMASRKENEAQSEDDKEKNKWAKWKQGAIIGAAALTGGTLLAITGGLAAPAIAAGFGALAPTLGTLVPIIGSGGFAAAASAAGTVAGSCAIAASFGAAGAGLAGSKMAKRIGDIDEFEFVCIGENHNQGRLAVGILVSGFVFEEDDFIKPWEGPDGSLERYALQWESKHLIGVSTAIQDWLTSSVTSQLMKQGAMLTVLSTLVAALAWPAALLGATNFIDSKWAIALDRSDKAGKLLAEALLKGLHGNRPVTLVGFSLGARVVFKCLQHLAETPNIGDGIVERVVLLGAPIPLKDESWNDACKMVAGRFINAYSSNDWVLGIVFRASLLTEGLAGIQPIEVAGIENVDVTEMVDGHSSYLTATRQILEQLELDVCYPVFSSSPVN